MLKLLGVFSFVVHICKQHKRAVRKEKLENEEWYVDATAILKTETCMFYIAPRMLTKT